MRILHVSTTTHGRVLIEDAAVSSRGHLVGFHGYGETAGDMLAQLNQIPGADQWTRVSIQALNRFYTRNDAKVVANWMTREDRELAIADNIKYVDTVLDGFLAPGTQHAAPSTQHVAPSTKHPALFFTGFSQGAAMAYRAAILGRHRPSLIVALAGDIPPDCRGEACLALPWPRILIGVGDTEPWYAGEKLSVDLDFLTRNRIDHEVVRFAGGHEWTTEFRKAVGARLLLA